MRGCPKNIRIIQYHQMKPEEMKQSQLSEQMFNCPKQKRNQSQLNKENRRLNFKKRWKH